MSLLIDFCTFLTRSELLLIILGIEWYWKIYSVVFGYIVLVPDL